MMAIRPHWTAVAWAALRACAVGFFLPLCAAAQQQQQGVCAMVRIEIRQELALERIGFEATLTLTDNDPIDPITDFSAALTFENPAYSTSSNTHDAASLFFVRAPELEGIADVNGQGMILPGQTATIRWFIIPRPSAGGTSPRGVRYRVGCNLAGSIRGEKIPDDVLYAIPDMIVVQPEPLLDIAYFLPRDVQGDDPFTETVESPVPFALGVLVKNVGYGNARNVGIYSEQPRIVENKQRLLMIPRLLGVRVMDYPLNRTSLTANVGTLEPGQTRKAAWDMMTSLSGEFIEFKASYTHAPELGGEETSVISNLATHILVREVLNDQPDRDEVLDFLADTDRDPEMLPDALYESEGFVLPVNHLPSASVGPWGGPGQTVTVTVDVDKSGWGYVRVADPAQARLPLQSVVRGDGKQLDGNNVWSSYRYDDDNTRRNHLHLFDLLPLGEASYEVTYGVSGADTSPPVTTVEFAGPVSSSGSTHVVTPETQIFFLSQDESPVSIVYGIDGEPFQTAYPFRLTSNGVFTVSFFGEDSHGNVEPTQTVSVVVQSTPPAVGEFSLSESELVLAGDAFSTRPRETLITFDAGENPTAVRAELDILRGVPGGERVRHVVYEGIGTNRIAFAWDGKTDSGEDVLPGWYTVRLGLFDALGYVTYTVSEVYIGELEAERMVAVAVESGAGALHGRGSWLVWHDQRHGNDEIRARRLSVSNAPVRAVTEGVLNQQNPSTDGRYVVWQGREVNGNWDVYLSDLSASGLVTRVTWTAELDEINPVIDWPWVVYQARSASIPGAPWQLHFKNLATGEGNAVWPSSHDQIHPSLRAGRVVWQDWRDTGPGEIYFKDLETGEPRRLTHNVSGQYAPSLGDDWVVWQDARHVSNELYGYRLSTGREYRLTETPWDAFAPQVEGDLVLFLENSVGPLSHNLRMMHLPSGRTLPVTRSASLKSSPRFAGTHVAWLDDSGDGKQVVTARLPGVFALMRSGNLLPVTESLAARMGDAFTLLNAWRGEVNVTRLVRIASLVPYTAHEAATWSPGGADGENFPLVAGEALWFECALDGLAELGPASVGPVSLPDGISALNYAGFPQPYGAHALVRQLGTSHVHGLRMLDQRTGEWLTVEVRGETMYGKDFAIPRAAVLLLDMVHPVTNWNPE
jgi:hypothetical protein